MKKIDRFRGQYEFLSNFYAHPVLYEGVWWRTAEHAFQQAKTLETDWKAKFKSIARPGEAKALGRHVPLRPGWDKLRIVIMKEVLRSKFSTPSLRKHLLDTGTAILVEGNTWNDQFWGVYKGIGENHLGKLLMELRSELGGSK